jgi:hypothetical protein
MGWRVGGMGWQVIAIVTAILSDFRDPEEKTWEKLRSPAGCFSWENEKKRKSKMETWLASRNTSKPPRED